VERPSVAEPILPRIFDASVPSFLVLRTAKSSTIPASLRAMQCSKQTRRLSHRRAKKGTWHAGTLCSERSCSGSSSLGQVGASAKEVSHKAEAKILENAASIHAEGWNAKVALAGRTRQQRLKGLVDRGRAESRRLLEVECDFRRECFTAVDL
jgi:hypothetical protein